MESKNLYRFSIKLHVTTPHIMELQIMVVGVDILFQQCYSRRRLALHTNHVRRINSTMLPIHGLILLVKQHVMMGQQFLVFSQLHLGMLRVFKTS
jgi:hypothetical protein